MSTYTRETWIRITMLATWLALGLGGLAVVDPNRDTTALAAVLVAGVASLSMLRPFPWSHLVVAVLAGGAYAAIQGLRSVSGDVDPDAPYIPAGAVGAFVIVLTAIVGDIVRDGLVEYDAELEARQRVIDEVEAIDPTTGATKRSHAERLLTHEVERARRYGRSFSVVMIAPDAWADFVARVGLEQARETSAELARAYLPRLRTVDTLVHMEGGRFAAILPETDVEGAQVVAEKIAEVGQEVVGAEVRAGIAGFPDDEVTATGLLHEADEALAFARTASISVASRNLLT